MRLIKLVCILVCVYTPNSYACESDAKSSYPPLTIDGGSLVFEPVAVLEDVGKPDPEMGIGLSFLDCSTGIKTFIARMPYVADPGEVQDAFLVSIAGDRQELFIIHSAPVRAFTGVSYGSDYFNVMAFNKRGTIFTFDKAISDYFGAGADVVIHREENDVPVYTYPFKTQEKIVEQLKSDRFRDWYNHALPELTVVDKAFIYSSMAIADRSKMYLVKGDRVKQEAVSAGWISILYKTAKGKDIRGWVLCEAVGGC